jgi:hypothetical protein
MDDDRGVGVLITLLVGGVYTAGLQEGRGVERARAAALAP